MKLTPTKEAKGRRSRLKRRKSPVIDEFVCYVCRSILTRACERTAKLELFIYEDRYKLSALYRGAAADCQDCILIACAVRCYFMRDDPIVSLFVRPRAVQDGIMQLEVSLDVTDDVERISAKIYRPRGRSLLLQ